MEVISADHEEMYMCNDAEFYSNLGNETSEKLSPNNIDASSADNREIKQGPTSTIGQAHSNDTNDISWWPSCFSLCHMLLSIPDVFRENFNPKSPAQDVDIDKRGQNISYHNATPSMKRRAQYDKHEG
eukprot:15340870-Ditylum_brightwellii.AAC.1